MDNLLLLLILISLFFPVLMIGALLEKYVNHKRERKAQAHKQSHL